MTKANREFMNGQASLAHRMGADAFDAGISREEAARGQNAIFTAWINRGWDAAKAESLAA